MALFLEISDQSEYTKITDDQGRDLTQQLEVTKIVIEVGEPVKITLETYLKGAEVRNILGENITVITKDVNDED